MCVWRGVGGSFELAVYCIVKMAFRPESEMFVS